MTGRFWRHSLWLAIELTSIETDVQAMTAGPALQRPCWGSRFLISMRGAPIRSCRAKEATVMFRRYSADDSGSVLTLLWLQRRFNGWCFGKSSWAKQGRKKMLSRALRAVTFSGKKLLPGNGLCKRSHVFKSKLFFLLPLKFERLTDKSSGSAMQRHKIKA
jgi:hypothetical protein